MTPEEIERIVRIASRLGIRNVKLTGGEPTVRPDIYEIIQRIRPYVVDLSMTTNGTTLYASAEKLKEAGLDRVNISLDTLDRKKYKMITGYDVLDQVLKGIRRATNLFYPVKLNMVVMRGINDDEIWDMIRFAGEVNAILQLIEIEVPREMENSQFFKDFFYPLKPLEEKFEKIAVEIRERKMHRRRKYFLPVDGKMVEVEVVRSMHNTTFCMNCTRLRLTADGYLKTCLLRKDDLIDILGPIRRGATDDELVKIFKRAVQLRKPYWIN